MSDILERILSVKNKAWTKTGRQPNVIRMNMADYKELCAVAAADESPWAELSYDDKKKPSAICGMRIKKRAGEMECVFDENTPAVDCMTAETLRKFSEYLKEMTIKPETCEHGMIKCDCSRCNGVMAINLISEIKLTYVPDDADAFGTDGKCSHGNEVGACAECDKKNENGDRMISEMLDLRHANTIYERAIDCKECSSLIDRKNDEVHLGLLADKAYRDAKTPLLKKLIDDAAPQTVQKVKFSSSMTLTDALQWALDFIIAECSDKLTELKPIAGVKHGVQNKHFPKYLQACGILDHEKEKQSKIENTRRG